MSHTVRRTRARRLTALAASLSLSGALALSGCQIGGDAGSDGAGTSSDGSGSAGAEAESGPTITASIRRGARNVAVDAVPSVSIDEGRIQRVSLTGKGAPKVPGRLSADGLTWTADAGALEPGTTYTWAVVARGADGSTRSTQRFTTRALSLDEQTYASVAPLDGETVGVGMPVVVSFDLPVSDKAAFERHMTVTSTPSQPGSWHWMSDTEAHWRPKAYWKPGTRVSVDVDVNSLPAGNGIYGQDSRQVAFTVGDAHIYRIDTRTHEMKVFSNGRLLRTIPVTTGKQPDFTTRSGVKVIMEKFESRRMRSETVGIGRDNPEFYDIDDVKWAMRLTSSGEFIHAAPWSVGSQGRANVSHGCTGLSTADAGWLYSMTRRGDVVETVGTDRPMELANGYGDWNLPFGEYRTGSALV